MNCDANYLVKASDFGFVFLFLSSWMATSQTSPTEYDLESSCFCYGLVVLFTLLTKSLPLKGLLSNSLHSSNSLKSSS